MQPCDGLGVAAAAQVCIPGSHKRNFLPPDNSDERLRGQSLWGDGVPEIDIYDGPPTVANLCPKAGSCIIFTEALRVRLKTAAPFRDAFCRLYTLTDACAASTGCASGRQATHGSPSSTAT